MTCWLQGSCRAKTTFLSCLKLAQGGQAFIVSHQSVVECRLPLEWARPGVRQISSAEAILKGLITKKYLSAYNTPIRWDVLHWGRILVSHHRARFSRLLPSICYQKRRKQHWCTYFCSQEWPRGGWLWGVGRGALRMSLNLWAEIFTCMFMKGFEVWDGAGVWSGAGLSPKAGCWFSLHFMPWHSTPKGQRILNLYLTCQVVLQWYLSRQKSRTYSI